MVQFTLLERKILRTINHLYPVPCRPHEKEIIAVGERPLPTRDDIAAQFRHAQSSDIDSAIEKLLAFQLISRVYLHSHDGFHETMLVPGEISRFPVANGSPGICAYQILPLGQKTINAFFLGRFVRWIKTVFGKIAEDYIQLFIAFLLGMALASVLGLDVRKFSIGPFDMETNRLQQQSTVTTP